MLPQALAVINGKGGTLKTAVAATTAGILAAAGYRVLAVDWDPQGNLADDLGVHGTEWDDDGTALAAAVTGQAPLAPVGNVRDRLDLAVAGEALEGVTGVNLEAALAPVADAYDLIIIDCPPGNRPLQLAALAAARFVVIPTRADASSLRGLRRVARLFAEVRGSANPGLELLGVVLAGIGSQSRQLQRMFRDDVATLFGRDDAAFQTVIRHAEAPAIDARRMGRLVTELGKGLYTTMATELGPRRLAASAPGLAGDHQRLAAEIAERITARVEAAGP